MNTLFSRSSLLRNVLSFVIAFSVLSFVALPVVYAQTSLADVCGQTTATSQACKITDIKKVTGGLLSLIIKIGLPVLIVFVSYRILITWFAILQGKTTTYHEALKDVQNAIIGFLFIVALFGGLFYVIFNVLGVGENFLKPIRAILGESLITHAYAAGDTSNPATSPFNPLPGVTSLYDLLLSLVRLFMRFFVYPGLIIAWVMTGFLFVFAQGNPEKLNKAKSLLLKAFLATLAIFTLQGFLIAAQGTVNRILPSEKTTTTQQTAPTTSELQSSCAARGGTLSSDNQCYGASDTQAASLQNCADKNIGVVCYIPQSSGTTKVGTCSYVSDSSSDKECRPAQVGDACVTTALINGTINSNNICETSQRPLVGDGGSCRGDFECSSPLKCVNNVCRTSGQSTTDGSSCLVDRRLPGTMKNGVCVSNTKAQTDVACTKANGGSCTINFQPGFCQDWRCIPNTAASQSYVDPCPALNQVHMSCTAANGNPGTCLLNVVVNPPKFVCVPK